MLALTNLVAEIIQFLSTHSIKVGLLTLLCHSTLFYVEMGCMLDIKNHGTAVVGSAHVCNQATLIFKIVNPMEQYSTHK
jgi:hypothetical protein